jgi:chloramphenicol 3-O-phosphotransferase
MKLLFLHGPPAAGKYTIARLVADATGLPLFHNHLIVDAVHAVFPFGSPHFVTLRERFWLDVIRAAVAEGRSLIFTFQPESSVSPCFPATVARTVTDAGGECLFVALHLPLEQQLARVANEDRGTFGKLRDAALLEQLHADFAACEAAMPASALTIDTATTPPAEAAARIIGLL